MASAAGSGVFSILALLLICAFVLLLLRHYLPLRKTPAYFIIPIFLALALPLSIILLVPIDLAGFVEDEGERRAKGTSAIWLPSGLLQVCWRLSYWLTFALTWYIKV